MIEWGCGERFEEKDKDPTFFVSTCTIPGMTVIYRYIDSCHVSILKRYTICLN